VKETESYETQMKMFSLLKRIWSLRF